MDDEVLAMFVATVIAVAAMCTMVDTPPIEAPQGTVVAALWSAH